MKKCLKCGQIFDDEKGGVEWNGRIIFKPNMCQSCKDKVSDSSKELEKKAIRNRFSEFLRLCPPQYRENDISKIKQEAWERVMAWNPNARGILCYGVSQRGKSTACWRLMEKLYVDKGIRFEAVTEAEFGQRAADANANRSLREWIEHMSGTPVLFLDDVGHAAMTAKYLEYLYLVVEKRTAWKRPIVATTQFDKDELENKTQSTVSVKTVQAILNRLKAHCEEVEF